MSATPENSSGGSSKPEAVYLVPWDAADEGQVGRMVDQRVACGWRDTEVPEWKGLMLRGEKVFYWIVIEDTVPEKKEFEKANEKMFPAENSPLKDTCASVFGQARSPTNQPFYPVGHVALQAVSGFDCERLELPLSSTAWVKNLYISWALHRGGFGRSTMRLLERLARSPPFLSTHLLLDTMHPEFQRSEAFLRAQYDDRGFVRPPGGDSAVRTNVDWYERQGWSLFGPTDEVFAPKDDEGNEIARVPCVYMKKALG
ncbi:hypothetical protein N3K66_000505 [Trichothecium roseum]|uniref:Uncharacterized protein n=1 Tax=Trichothecium roseum TaxID=47278 RepID=A0ACC0VC36_9HYPO|nr:hypothetical protein N3K66_000505 [Trichothecium roseum]